jgi:hypothetical protein
MRRLLLAMAGLTVLAALLAAMACGGGGGEGEATPTSVPGEVEEQLKQMVLALEDLPSGVILAEELLVTNEESAAAADDPAERLAKLKEWGRILGYDVTYQANPEVTSQVGLILLNSTASLYGSEAGARASFADAVETARTTDWAALFGGDLEVNVEEVDTPPLTDEMLWLHITAKAEIGEEPQEETLANDTIIFRQGSARASLQAAWVVGKGSSNPIEQLAQAQAERLKDALP